MVDSPADSEVVRQAFPSFCHLCCQTLRSEFQDEFLICPITPRDWEKLEEVTTKWYFLYHVGYIDGTYVAIKKPPHERSK